MGFIFALEWEFASFGCKEISSSLSNKVSGEFPLKEIALVPYLIAVVQKLIKSFSYIQFEHIPKAHNMQLDDLATLAFNMSLVRLLMCVLLEGPCKPLLQA